MCFGFLSDVVGPTVQPVSMTTFELAPTAIRMPMLATMEAQWVAAGADPFLPPFGPADANTELIRT